MVKERVDSLAWLRKQVEAADKDLLREMVKGMLETLMSSEVDAVCGAPYHTPSSERINHRNGYRERRWDTRVGTIDIAIPRVRKGSYFPEWLLQRRRRSERALVQVVTESYVRGISTRRVEGLIRTLGVQGMSKSQVSELAKELDGLVEGFRHRSLADGPYTFVWLDALTQRCREDGHVVNVVTVIATGVNGDGHREILGVDVFTSEDGAGWSSFLRGVSGTWVERGEAGDLRCAQWPEGGYCRGVTGECVAEVSCSLHEQPAEQSTEERTGSGSDDGAFDLRSANGQRSVGAAQASD